MFASNQRFLPTLLSLVFLATLALSNTSQAHAAPPSLRPNPPSLSKKQWIQVLRTDASIITSPSRTRQIQASLPRLGTQRQAQNLANPDLLTASLVLLIPTTLAELTVFVGNLTVFSTGRNQLAWGIQGVGLGLLGALVSVPWILQGLENAYAIPFIALHVVVLGLGVTNIVQATQSRRRLAGGSLAPQAHTQAHTPSAFSMSFD